MLNLTAIASSADASSLANSGLAWVLVLCGLLIHWTMIISIWVVIISILVGLSCGGFLVLAAFALVALEYWNWFRRWLKSWFKRKTPTLFNNTKIDKIGERRLRGFRILDLPPELRGEIFKFCVDIPAPIDNALFAKYRTKIAAVTAVYKQFQVESEPLFYRRNDFRHVFEAYPQTLRQFLTTTNRFSPLWKEYGQEIVLYPFPRRIRPMIRHLELVLAVPNPEHMGRNVALWLRPLTRLQEDGFTGLHSLKVSFEYSQGFTEFSLSWAQRDTIVRAARHHSAGSETIR